MVPRLVRLLVLVPLVALAPSCGDPGAQGQPAQERRPAYDRDGVPLAPASAPKGPRPNVLVVLVDTLRADAIDLSDPAGGTMPYLASLARSGVCFTNASSAASWTLPSLLSLFTSTLPHVHGVTGEDLVAPSVTGLTSWAEILSHQGYQTAAFVGASWPDARQGLLQGFEQVVDGFTLQAAPELLAPWLAARDRTRPFFLFLHTYEAHDPYGAEDHPARPRAPPTRAEAQALLDGLGPTPPAHELVRRMILEGPVRDLLQRDPRVRSWQSETTRYLWSGLAREPRPALAQELAAAYRHGLAWVDGQLRAALEHLGRAGALDGTLLAITGDHGEAFGEHGMLLHGRALYDELVHVPLVLRGPAPFDRPQVLGASVGLTDLMPTVLDLVGAPPADETDGRSLLPVVLRGGAGRPVEAEEVRTHFHTAGESIAVLGSVRSATQKFLATYEMKAGTYREELYDLVADPGERTNLAAEDGVVRTLPADEAFCRAVERLRARLWGASDGVSFQQEQQGYGSGLKTLTGPRPSSPCGPAAGS